MRYASNDRGVLPILVAILIVVLVAVVGVAIYNVNKTKQKNAQTYASPSPTSSPVSTASPFSTPTPTASTTFDIADLGVQFSLPAELSDLEYKVVHLGHDQSVNSVAFSTKRLKAAGCSLDSAPLGHLTYDNYLGGTLVANARNSNLYYLQPPAGCKADASLQSWQVLQTALRALVTDGRQDKTNR